MLAVVCLLVAGSLHSHAHPAVTLVLRGGFTETFESDAVRHCGERSLLFKPALGLITGYTCSGPYEDVKLKGK